MLFGAACAGHLSDPASRPAVVRLLAVPLPEHDDAVAAVPQPAAVGFLGALHLRADLGHVLVSRPVPDLASVRDRAQSRGKQVVYGFFACGFRGSRPAVEALSRDLWRAGGDHGAGGRIDPQHRRAGLCRRRHRRLAFDRVPALLRFRRAALRLRDRAAADHPAAPAPAARRHDHRPAFRRACASSCSRAACAWPTPTSWTSSPPITAETGRSGRCSPNGCSGTTCWSIGARSCST